MLVNDDCFMVMKNIKDSSVDLIVTDPPYGISFEGKDWDKFDEDDYETFLSTFLSECKRILTPEGSMWMFYGITKIESVIKCINKSGLINHWENATVYCRPKGRGSTKKMKSQREEIVHLTKGKKYCWNPVEYLREVVVPYTRDGKPRGWALDQATGQRVRWTGIGNVAFFTPPSFINIAEKQIHSCQKPVLLFTELIMLSSKKGATVLDPFAGSAASGVAAYLCDRNYLGIEKDKDMFEKAQSWFSEVQDPNSRVGQALQEYLKKRVSSSEENFKFSWKDRFILPK